MTPFGAQSQLRQHLLDPALLYLCHCAKNPTTCSSAPQKEDRVVPDHKASYRVEPEPAPQARNEHHESDQQASKTSNRRHGEPQALPAATCTTSEKREPQETEETEEHVTSEETEEHVTSQRGADLAQVLLNELRRRARNTPTCAPPLRSQTHPQHSNTKHNSHLGTVGAAWSILDRTCTSITLSSLI